MTYLILAFAAIFLGAAVSLSSSIYKEISSAEINKNASKGIGICLINIVFAFPISLAALLANTLWPFSFKSELLTMLQVLIGWTLVPFVLSYILNLCLKILPIYKDIPNKMWRKIYILGWLYLFYCWQLSLLSLQLHHRKRGGDCPPLSDALYCLIELFILFIWYNSPTPSPGLMGRYFLGSVPVLLEFVLPVFFRYFSMYLGPCL